MLLSHIQYAIRMLRKTPVFSVVIILTIALSIAASTAIFSLVNAVLLRPLPFRQPNRLVQVAEKNDKLHLSNFGASVLNFISWREQTQTLEEVGAIGFTTFTLTSNGEPEQISGNRISPATLHVLGLDAVAGRNFTADEEKPGAAVVMLGEDLWKRRFGGDPAVVGRKISLNGEPVTVVGIAPASLNLFSGGEVFAPLTVDPAKEIRLNHVILVVGRLKNGVTLQQAQVEMDAVAGRVGQQYPEVRDWGIHLLTFFDTFVSNPIQTGLLVLLAGVLFVLLIACTNIANMLLARASARQKEMALRAAMGANRGVLLQQLLTENVILSGIGGVIGLASAFAAIRLLNSQLPPNLLPVSDIHPDFTVLAFGLALTLLTGLIFGLAPSWRLAKVNLNEVLKRAGRSSGGAMKTRMRNALAAVEFAVATILLIGAGLLLQSFLQLQRVPIGFDSRGVMTFQLAPPTAKYPVNSKAPLFYRELLESLRAIPGVRDAGVSSGIPFGAGNYTTSPMKTSGESVLPVDAVVPVDWRIVSPSYFKTMSIPLLRGRDFTHADGAQTPVAIVSAATARKFWGDADPIGRTIRHVAAARDYTIIGVVGDVRNTALNQESLSLYYSLADRVWPLMDIAVRFEGPTDVLMPAIRQKVHDLDPDLALANVRSMDDWLSNTAAQPRLNTILITLFAAAALLIAAIGIYGVLAYSVNQRTQEIGIRMALGANPAGVLRLIIGEGVAIAAIGTGIGLLGGYGMGQALAGIVYGVSVHDVRTFTGVALVLSLVAIAASAVPARRAARLDPLVALRSD